MKANELRIGNLIYANGLVFRVIRIDEDGMEAAPLDLDEWKNSPEQWKNDFKPIPLTEEWLVKFGFEWSIFHQAYHKTGFLFDVNARYDGGYYLHGCRNSASIIMPEILFVHQLQNLYFALTGTELEIKKC